MMGTPPDGIRGPPIGASESPNGGKRPPRAYGEREVLPSRICEKKEIPKMYQAAGMLEKLNYRTALFLSALLAGNTCVGWGIIAAQSPQFTRDAINVSVVSLAIPFGLWLGSNLVRYVGAALMVLWAGGLIWPLFSSATPIPLHLYFVFSAALSLLTAAILLLSRKFATEFAAEQKNQPKYKTYLRWSLLGAVVGAMILATVNDIIHLANG